MKPIKQLVAGLILLLLAISTEIATTYYASPTGVGSTCSLASPGTAVACLAVASGGDTLILKNGTYTGDSGMLHPPTNRSGTAGNVITVTAETDGGVLIDGQGARIPVLWDHNDYWTVSGINAANSSSDVMSIYPGSDNNIFSRICAWNANPDGNFLVWQFWQANNNLAVDTCAFGTGRKMYASFEMSGLTIRRPFAMWNHINVDTGPFIVYSLFYDSDHVIIENPIGTRDEDADSFDMGATDQGIFSADRLDEYNDCELHSGYYGGLALILNTQNIIQNDNHGGEIHGSQVAGNITFQDDLLYITPGSHPTLRRILMAQYDSTFTGGCAATTLTANRKMTNVTTIGQGDGSFPNLIDTSSPNNGWTNTNYTDVNSIGAIYPGSGETLYVGSNGTKLRCQYINGTLSSPCVPLWPWPMNERIKAAMSIAGRAPFDVNATRTSLFGLSPDESPAGTPPIQNFDSNTTNANLDGTTGGSGGWNAAWVCDSPTTMTTPLATSGGQGGKTARSNSALGGGKYCYRTFDAVSAGSFRFEMSTDALPNSDDYGMQLNEAGVGARARIDMRSDGNISAYNYQTSTYVTICPYSLTVHYRIVLEIDTINQPNKYRARCGETGTNTTWIGAAGTFSVANTFTIEDNSTIASHKLDIDAIGSTTELTSITPATGVQGATVAGVMVGLRTAWVNGTSVCALVPATNITINSTTIADATDGTCNLTIGAGAATGLRDVTVTTGTAVETLTGAFNITASAPQPITTPLGFRIRLRSRVP